MFFRLHVWYRGVLGWRPMDGYPHDSADLAALQADALATLDYLAFDGSEGRAAIEEVDGALVWEARSGYLGPTPSLN